MPTAPESTKTRDMLYSLRGLPSSIVTTHAGKFVMEFHGISVYVADISVSSAPEQHATGVDLMPV